MKNRRIIFTAICFILMTNALLNAQTEQTVKDIDGNVYRTISLGNQVWMIENLKVTRYRNGDKIPNVTNQADWDKLNSGSYCWYNNEIANKTNYGALYNWYAVSDSRNLAPQGWHIATEKDWKLLATYFQVMSEAGTKTKVTSFSGLLGGYRGSRESVNSFYNINKISMWWSSTNGNDLYAVIFGLRNGDVTLINTLGNKYFGSSVRCVKD